MFDKLIGSIVRTGAAVLSGVLISKGVPPEVVDSVVNPASAALVGFLGYFGVQWWSIAEKKVREEVKKRF